MPDDPMTTIPDRPTPSTASYILATCIVAACAGYFLGQASSVGLFSSKPKPKSSSSGKSKAKSSWPNSYDVTVHPDTSDEDLMTRLKGGQRRIRDSEDDESESESESESDESDGRGDSGPAQEQGGLKSFEDNREECKLVLVVRTDLGMGKGKIAAQCAHAALACYKHLVARGGPAVSPLLRRWEANGGAKIAVQVGGAEQLELLRREAVGVGLCARVVCDAGRTQVARGSVTVLGVGPGPRGVVDGVTGGLRLL